MSSYEMGFVVKNTVQMRRTHSDPWQCTQRRRVNLVTSLFTGNVRPPVASGRDVLSLPKGGALRYLDKVNETTCNV